PVRGPPGHAAADPGRGPAPGVGRRPGPEAPTALRRLARRAGEEGTGQGRLLLREVEQGKGGGELRRLAVLIVLVAAAVVGTAGGAEAHSAGRVQLLVTNLQFNRMGHDLMVSADLIDRDSGASAAGFAIV